MIPNDLQKLRFPKKKKERKKRKEKKIPDTVRGSLVFAVIKYHWKRLPFQKTLL